MRSHHAILESRPTTTTIPATVIVPRGIRVLEAKSPSSFRGWEAIDAYDPTTKGIVLSDEYSEHLHIHLLTIDWNTEPPEIVMVDRDQLMELEDGYLLIPAAGRNIGFIPLPLIHKCGSQCLAHEAS